MAYPNFHHTAVAAAAAAVVALNCHRKLFDADIVVGKRLEYNSTSVESSAHMDHQLAPVGDILVARNPGYDSSRQLSHHFHYC